MNPEEFLASVEAEIEANVRERESTRQLSAIMRERTLRDIEAHEAWRAKWKRYEWIGDPPWCFLAVALLVVAGFVLGGWIAELSWGIACHAR